VLGRSTTAAPAATQPDMAAAPPPAAPPLPVASIDSSAVTSPATSNPSTDSLASPTVTARNEPRVRPIADRLARRAAVRTGDADRSAPLRQLARLTVASEPYGTLYVDGVEIGDTPIANYQLPVGRRVELRVERDGYKTKRESIMVNGPNAIRRRYILEAGEQP